MRWSGAVGRTTGSLSAGFRIGLAVLGVMASAAAVVAAPIAFVQAHIVPVAGAEIARGTLVVDGRRIVAVGASEAISIPPGAEVRDLSGRVVLPGLVDTHSHLGRGSGGDRSSALHPEVRLLDALDVRSDNLWKARAGGITTLNIMPGSGHLLSGQTVYLKLRDAGGNVEDWLICADAGRRICGGLKMANGTNSMQAPTPPFPGSRARSAALQRGLFVRAQEYRRKLEVATADPTKRPDRDLGLEALAEVLDGRRVVHFHTHRADDIATAIRLATEFGFRPVLHHLSDGGKMAREIARAGLPASITFVDSPGGKLEAMGVSYGTAAALEQAGVSLAIHTDDSVTDSRFLLRSAAMAVRGGLSRAKAIEALTLAPAKMLGLGQAIGSLEAGKDADFVVLSGDPFATATHVDETWVEGRKVFDRARDGKYLVGGAGVYRVDAEESDDGEGRMSSNREERER